MTASEPIFLPNSLYLQYSPLGAVPTLPLKPETGESFLHTQSTPKAWEPHLQNILQVCPRFCSFSCQGSGHHLSPGWRTDIRLYLQGCSILNPVPTKPTERAFQNAQLMVSLSRFQTPAEYLANSWTRRIRCRPTSSASSLPRTCAQQHTDAMTSHHPHCCVWTPCLSSRAFLFLDYPSLQLPLPRPPHSHATSGLIPSPPWWHAFPVFLWHLVSISAFNLPYYYNYFHAFLSSARLGTSQSRDCIFYFFLPVISSLPRRWVFNVFFKKCSLSVL